MRIIGTDCALEARRAGSPVKSSIFIPITKHRVTIDDNECWWLHFMMADFVLEQCRVLQVSEGDDEDEDGVQCGPVFM